MASVSAIAALCAQYDRCVDVVLDFREKPPRLDRHYVCESIHNLVLSESSLSVRGSLEGTYIESLLERAGRRPERVPERECPTVRAGCWKRYRRSTRRKCTYFRWALGWRHLQMVRKYVLEPAGTRDAVGKERPLSRTFEHSL